MNTDFERISRFVDGEVDAAERSEVTALLDISDEAKAALNELNEFNALAAEAYPRMRFRRPVLPVKTRPGRLRYAAAAAIVLGLTGLAYGAYRALSQNPPQDVAVQNRQTEQPTLVANEPANTNPVAAPQTSPVHTAGFKTIDGEVFDVRGKPVAAVVFAIGVSRDIENDEHPLTSARTDPQGRFSLRAPKDTSSLLVTAGGYRAKMVNPWQWDMKNATTELALRMTHGNQLSGTVVNKQGAPVPGAKVVTSLSANFPQVFPAGMTDESGRFVVDEPSEGGAIWVTHPDYAVKCFERPEELQTTSVVVEPGASVQVRVLKDGAPVSGALVRIEMPLELLPTSPKQRSDAAGVVTFASIPPEVSYSVTAATDSGDYVEAAAVARAGKSNAVVLQFPTYYPIHLAGHVYDAETNPVPGATITAAGVDSGIGVRRTVVSRADGSFEIGLQTGATSISAALDRRYAEKFQVGKPGAGASLQHDFVIAPEKRITIAMKDVQGNPVLRANLFMDTGIHTKVQTTDGTFNMNADMAKYITAMTPDNCLARLSGESDGAANLAFTSSGATVEGTVVDENNIPLRLVTVSVSGDKSTLVSGGQTETDDQGRFEVGPMSVGNVVTISAGKNGYEDLHDGVKLKVAATNSPLRIVLTNQSAVVAGRVTFNDGTPAGAAAVWIHRGDAFVSAGETAVDGTFTLRAAPGLCTVTVRYSIGTENPSRDVEADAPVKNLEIVLPVASTVQGFDMRWPTGPEHVVAANSMKQMGLVFKMFANESQGQKFPELDDRYGVLMPKSESIYPEYLTDKFVLDRVEGKQQAQLVYPGYAIANEADANAFFDAYESLGPDGMAGQDIKSDASSPDSKTIMRLREGIERFYITDINDPTSGARAQANIPVLWELPGSHPEPGGWVLYMDGHVSWLPYPGPYPMTETMVNRINAIQSGAKK